MIYRKNQYKDRIFESDTHRHLFEIAEYNSYENKQKDRKRREKERKYLEKQHQKKKKKAEKILKECYFQATRGKFGCSFKFYRKDYANELADILNKEHGITAKAIKMPTEFKHTIYISWE